jgi:hypothetical protein
MIRRWIHALAALSCYLGVTLLIEVLSEHPVSQQRVLVWGLVAICLYIPAQHVCGADPPRLGMRPNWHSRRFRNLCAVLLTLIPVLILAGSIEIEHLMTAVFSVLGVPLMYDSIRVLTDAPGTPSL